MRCKLVQRWTVEHRKVINKSLMRLVYSDWLFISLFYSINSISLYLSPYPITENYSISWNTYRNVFNVRKQGKLTVSHLGEKLLSITHKLRNSVRGQLCPIDSKKLRVPLNFIPIY